MRGQNIYRLIPALSVLSLWACVFIGPELNLTCWHSEFLSPCLASGPCNIIFLHPSSVCLHHFQMFFWILKPTLWTQMDVERETLVYSACVILESPVLGSATALVLLLLAAFVSLLLWWPFQTSICCSACWKSSVLPCAPGARESFPTALSAWLWQTALFLSAAHFEKLPSRCRILVPLRDNGASVSGPILLPHK